MPIGAGSIDWNRFIDSLIKAKHEGSLMLEIDERLEHNDVSDDLKKLQNGLDLFSDRIKI